MFPNTKDSVPQFSGTLLDLFSLQAGSRPTPSQIDCTPPSPVDRANMTRFLLQILTEALEIAEETELFDDSSSN